MKVHLANWFTASRIFLSFPIFFLLISGIPHYRTFSAILFCLAGLTDYLDGKIARIQGGGTPFGKFFDPLADKVLVILVLTGLIILEEVQLWMVLLIAIRELLVTLLRVGNVEKFSPTILAKSKTAFQMFGIAIILFIPCLASMLHQGGPLLKLETQHNLTYLIMMIILLVTIISGVQYVFVQIEPQKQGKRHN
ncbi:hypothetical protein AUJ66_00280 [Candidatus Desantisbacteria bacterium CG1_02_38_46]|nr:MAG: hypothetical protein AUJ66_00280 [Candidatus Desantisbacteria bacterium CG1_02_38_46]